MPRSRIIRVAVMHKKSAAPTFYSVPAKRQASSSSSSYGDVLTLQKWTVDRNLHLMELPEDVLYLLFRYLDLTSLGRLCQVCRKLRRLIQTDSVWLPFSRHQLVIREPQQGNLTKCRTCLPSLKEQCRMARNWTKGINREITIVRHHSRQLPWMQYDQIHPKTMWVSTGEYINCYKVLANGLFQEDKRRKLGPLHRDVTRFVVKDSLVVSGCREGSLFGWHSDTGKTLFCYVNVHTEDTQCVDFHHNLMVSGSRDATLKILSMDEQYNSNQPRATLRAEDRVWSVAMAPDGSTFASGSAGCNGSYPLIIWDLCKGVMDCSLGQDHRRGAGILDLKYEAPDILLSCGYDSYLRLWDLRTEKCEMMWEEPFDSAVYCVKTDGDCAMLTGTARHGMTRLWDKRATKPVQLYYAGHRSSPVYSLAFDCSHLYLALDISISMLDFSIYR